MSVLWFLKNYLFIFCPLCIKICWSSWDPWQKSSIMSIFWIFIVILGWVFPSFVRRCDFCKRSFSCIISKPRESAQLLSSLLLPDSSTLPLLHLTESNPVVFLSSLSPPLNLHTLSSVLCPSLAPLPLLISSESRLLSPILYPLSHLFPFPCVTSRPLRQSHHAPLRNKPRWIIWGPLTTYRDEVGEGS